METRKQTQQKWESIVWEMLSIQAMRHATRHREHLAFAGRGLSEARQVIVLGDATEWIRRIAQTHFGQAGRFTRTEVENALAEVAAVGPFSVLSSE